MRQPAHCDLALLRTVFFLLGSGLAMMLLLLSSCDEIERHKALTFFLDGVPPLQTQASATQLPGPKDSKAVDNAPAGGWYIHEPLKDCTNCHGQQRRTGFAGKVQLVAEVPPVVLQVSRRVFRTGGLGARPGGYGRLPALPRAAQDQDPIPAQETSA
jgi:hypothetical protein